MDEETRTLIKERATSLWLRAELDTLVARTKGRSHRPLLNNGDARTTLQQLIDTRYPIYSEADVAIDTGMDNPNITAARALDALEKHMGTTLATVP